MIYLDHCGTTPLSPDVSSSMVEFIRGGTFGNPSAEHHVVGKRAYESVESSRASIARVLGAAPSEIIFTSGAAEANNLVLWGFALRYRSRGCRILYGATEHKSIFDTAQSLSNLEGVSCQEIPVLADGSVNLATLEAQLSNSRGEPTLVCLMHINNEVPARHPIEKISALCRIHKAFFHCDGVQGFVRENIEFSTGLFGSYVLSAHKIYGPKGQGVLILGDNPLSTRIMPPYHGGSQERGLRPGTLNTLAICGAATAIEIHNKRRDERTRHMQRCTDIFVQKMTQGLENFRLTIPTSKDAPGIVNFYILDLDAPSILSAVPELCINRGSSCIGSGGEHFSHVPKALGLPIEIQANVLRASFGDAISENESALAAELLIGRVRQIKGPR